jgi:hypothetical protein
MMNIYQIREYPDGIAVVDVRTNSTINTWNPELKHMAVHFCQLLNERLNREIWSKPIYA